MAEPAPEAQTKQVLADIFGSDSDDDDAGPSTTAAVAMDVDPQKAKFVSSLEEERDSDDEGGAQYADGKKAPRAYGPPIELAAPFVHLAESDEVKMFRGSNILGVEHKPFDAARWDEEAEEVDEVDEMGREVKRVKLRNNIMRWRYAPDADGQPTSTRQSNARFVKWSDGSVQLLLGDEVLDIAEQDTSRDQTHLFVQLTGGTVQCLRPLTSKMVFRPSGLNSKSHKQLTAIVDKRHAKVNKLRRMLTEVDPEKEKEEREKVEEQRIKDRTHLQMQQERALEKGGYYGGAGLSGQYLEEEEPEEPEEFQGGDSLRNTLSSMRKQPPLSKEAEEERERRILDAKRGTPTASASGRKRAADSEDDHGGGVAGSDDDGGGSGGGKAAKKKRKNMAVMGDSDSD